MPPEITVEATPEKESADKADTATTGTQIETAIRDIPQAVSVVKEELIEAQACSACALR